MMTFFRTKRCSGEQTPAPGELNLRVAPEVKASVHPEGVVLIHHGRGAVFSANRVGARIWNGAAEHWSIQKLTASISNEFHIPPQDALKDAEEFLARLEAEGLLIRDRS